MKLIAFYGYTDSEKIEPLGAGDTDFSGFFFSPDFRDLCQELKIPRNGGEEAYNKGGSYVSRVQGEEDKFIYIVNTNFHFHDDDISGLYVHYRLIRSAIRDYKISNIL